MGNAPTNANPVLSGWTIRRILQSGGKKISLSFNLGITHTEISAGSEFFRLPDGQTVSFERLEDVHSKPEDCVELRETGPTKIYLYSKKTRKYYKLYQPEEDVAPTIVIAGATMHRIIGQTPWEDAEEKVSVIPRPKGRCLDTCFGLGYSAQLLEKRGANRVISCEKDPNVLSCARANPWSAGALTSETVQLIQKDVRTYLESCQPDSFQTIFHDPPTISQAGELYAGSLYGVFSRALVRGGTLFHYVGTPGGKQGKDLAGGIIRRLREAGFHNPKRRADGIVCRAG